MQVVDGMHAGQRQQFGRLSGDAGALPKCVMIHW